MNVRLHSKLSGGIYNETSPKINDTKKEPRITIYKPLSLGFSSSVTTIRKSIMVFRSAQGRCSRKPCTRLIVHINHANKLNSNTQTQKTGEILSKNEFYPFLEMQLMCPIRLC